jgi:hypothetical protein
MARDEPRFSRQPKFLQGTFHFKQLGYQFRQPPPIDLLGKGAEASDDPWIVLAAALARAKAADFSVVPRLREWALDGTVDAVLGGGCRDLLGDAGGRTELDFLAAQMLEAPSPGLKVEAAQSAAWSGLLWLIPYMLEVREQSERQADRDAVDVGISNVLESQEVEPELFAGTYSDPEYRALVTARVEAIKDAAGSEDVVVFGGEPVDMSKVIWQMRKALINRKSGEWINWGAFLVWRRKFETYTGVDCSKFYGPKGFQPLSATAVLDDYLAGPQPTFQPGKRYFFGHLVGDGKKE